MDFNIPNERSLIAENRSKKIFEKKSKMSPWEPKNQRNFHREKPVFGHNSANFEFFFKISNSTKVSYKYNLKSVNFFCLKSKLAELWPKTVFSR